MDDELIKYREWLQAEVYKIMVASRWSMNDLCSILAEHIHYGEWPRGTHDKVPYTPMQRWLTQKTYKSDCYLYRAAERFLKTRDKARNPADPSLQTSHIGEDEVEAGEWTDVRDFSQGFSLDSDCCMTEIEDNSSLTSEPVDPSEPLDILVQVAGEERNMWLECSTEYERREGQTFEEMLTKIV